MSDDFDIDLSEFDIDVPITKIDEDKRLAFGWASMVRQDGTTDKQGDFIGKTEDMEKAAYNFVADIRVAGEEHVRKGVGTLVESFAVTPEKLKAMGLPEGSVKPGWWVGFRTDNEDVWGKVKSGEYSMFSVHGRGRRTRIED